MILIDVLQLETILVATRGGMSDDDSKLNCKCQNNMHCAASGWDEWYLLYFECTKYKKYKFHPNSIEYGAR